MQKILNINGLEISNSKKIILIAGPCQMESREHALKTAEIIANICKSVGIGFIYKTSFDKANRSSISSKRGIGFENSIPIFQEIKHKVGCLTLTDVHTEEQCKEMGTVVDILQIPALLSRQTDLIVAAAKYGRAVNVKKGQFMAPSDMMHVVKKLEHANNTNIILTERGTCFGYNNLVNDMRGIGIMSESTYPVIFDATHSVQKPASESYSSGGERKFIEPLARAAVGVGIAGLYIETHENPDLAPSDGPCMLYLSDLKLLLEKLLMIDNVVKSF